jgi:site-specific DNA-cytosine methylase
MAIELFGCSGGMAEGFRRAGVVFDWAFDYSPEACESYAANLGHAPVRIDVRDLVRMARGGWRPGPLDLLVADPPCTPWSRAGKRKGLEDDRDMLRETVELIGLLRPRAYLIGNVPGLEDAPSWRALQRVLAPLCRAGYCILDFAVLDAADYGVPQHRIRPFWFGHLSGPCIRWPGRTHGDPAKLQTGTIPGVAPLRPWVTCRAALSHLPAEDLGRPVRIRWAEKKHADHRPSTADRPARTLTKNTHSDGALLANARHPINRPDSPSYTVCAKDTGGAQGAKVLAWPWDRPATTVCADARLAPPGHHEGSFLSAEPARKKRNERSRVAQGKRIGDPGKPGATITAKPSRVGAGEAHTIAWPLNDKHPPSVADEPAKVVPSSQPGNGGATMAWPWERPATTVCAGIDKIAPAGERSGFFGPDGERSGQFGPNAIVLSERAAAILQGFPEGWIFAGKTKRARWGQIGMAMPPPLAEVVARAVVEQMSEAEESAAE